MRSFLILLFLFPCYAVAAEWQSSSEIAKIFEENQASGTFVLFDVQRDRYIGYNEARATSRYIPASSFKIANSLIGLEAGAIKDVDEILPYGGGKQFLKVWEKDMSLRDAIKISNVPIYQELARRIGAERMGAYLKKLSYGNMNVGEVVDQFWLSGPLEISAVEQVIFLSKVANKQLPFDKNNQQQVIEITRLENTENYSLHGKTGLTTAPEPDIGWWVGWVQKGGRTYAFALNIDVNNDQDIPKREAIGRACLKALGIL